MTINLPAGVRRILEVSSRGVVLRKKMPRDLGAFPIHVTPDSGLKYWTRSLAEVDSWLFSMVRELVNPGDVIWDIGANVGLFAFGAAHRVGTSGEVLAVEADPLLCGLLRSSLTANGSKIRKMTILNVAASDEVGISQFCIANRARASNHLASVGEAASSGGVRSVEPVVTVTLDWLQSYGPQPTLIKIDVEGAEVKALLGATSILKTSRPKIIVEVSKENVVELTNLLRSFDYQLFNANQPSSQRTALSECAWNTLAVPR